MLACFDQLFETSETKLRKTFAEWKGALYAHDVPGQKLTCSACHMPGGEGAAANVPAAPKRRVHDHSMPGVDLALTHSQVDALENFRSLDGDVEILDLEQGLAAKHCRPVQRRRRARRLERRSRCRRLSRIRSSLGR